MSKQLKSLNDHDAERWNAHQELQRLSRRHPNGIACPKCGAELNDSNPSRTLLSNPPQKDVDCGACGYRGCRLA